MSEQRRLLEELGGRKFSQFLRRMRRLRGQRKLDDTLMRQLFLQRLLAQVHSILAVSDDSVSLEDMASSTFNCQSHRGSSLKFHSTISLRGYPVWSEWSNV